MTKPSITTRAGKGAALTYTELDNNFTNIKDATISITGGTGGTAVTADLNGNITLVAGSNVTITGNNSAKTITITSSASGSGTVQSGNANNFAFYSSSGTTIDDTSSLRLNSSGNVVLGSTLNMNGNTISSGGVGNIVVDDDINFPGGSGPYATSGGELRCRGGSIKLETTSDPGLNLAGITTGTPSNTSTPSSYLKVTVNGNVRYIPIFS